ncbi:hypothetical protein C8Q80DRAFT_1147700 [Daedaleopsis nitida]|nr:hypothetical protein C8Q80DRAFT_1147700 [Daedaleopsis nitida]
MTVVISSSRSPLETMSSVEHPSTPPAVASGHEEDGSTSSMTGVSNGYPQATNTDVDQDFCKHYLKQDTSTLVPTGAIALVEKIKNASNEKAIYDPCAQLLTLYSREFYATLPSGVKKRLRERHGDHPLTFIDHHTSPPTHFPDETLCPVKDAPDILAVYNVKGLKIKEGVYGGVPHHRVEAIVEAKQKGNSGGRAQASAYAYRHHQARPDHPVVFCLIVRTDWYQVIFSSPVGVVASPTSPWSDLKLLAGYVYAHYDPRATISSPGEKPEDLPTWSIKLNGKTYGDGSLIFIGEPWGQRTTVFLTRDKLGETYVIKDTYRHFKRRFLEEDILTHIHAKGDLPGIVRLKAAEQVKTQNRTIQCGSSEAGTLRIKTRLALHDYGERLLKATSLNDLLEAVYDALEVHRTLLRQRRVLHRDMSIYNILMYPQWKDVKGRQVADDAPPMIDDVLKGLRPVQERRAKCLVIDVDHAALLDKAGSANEEELEHRTGTPIYIARSVCVGRVNTQSYAFTGQPMPSLTGEALRLYVEAHGQERYGRYEEPNTTTRHGGLPPNAATYRPDNLPKFTHRAEHDVESIWWALLIATLRVCPKSSKKETFVHSGLARFWKTMHEHMIPHNPHMLSDTRHEYMINGLCEWKFLFTPEMKDFAVLIWQIAFQIAPEYALWTWESHQEDHLHEAVQRLILQYLVDHRDNPIPLDPDNLRPTKDTPPELNEIDVKSGGTRGQSDTLVASTSNLNKNRKNAGSSGRGGGTRGRGSSSKAPVKTSTTRTGSKRRSANANSEPYVAGSKRRTTSQGERSSKRLKNAAGSAVSTRDDNGDSDGDA